MPGPLDNLTIIEMAGIGPAPLAGQLLADLGAAVTVIDRSAGEDLSADINRRGKKSIALNLKEPEGVAAALKIIASTDILIEGFRPGIMERLGLGPDTALEANPRLVYARMTGWGQEGPWAQTAGHDLNYLALTGALNAMGKRGEPPVPPLNLVADYGGGSMFLVMGILAAIIERSISGKGQVVDAAMIDGVPAMMGLVQSMLASGNWTREREDNFIDGGAPYYRCYECSDGKYLSVGCIEPKFFARFLEIAGLDPAYRETQNDKRHWPEMHAVFEALLASKSRDEWASLFEESDACVAPVLDFDEAEKHPHNQARNTFVTRQGLRQTSPAPRFSRTQTSLPPPASKTGTESESILSGAGFTESQIRNLAKKGILL